MEDQLINSISGIMIKFAPHIITFVVGVIGLYNFRDMVVNWFIGITLKWNKFYNELDLFRIDGKRCLLFKIGSFRCMFLEIDENNNVKNELVTIGNKQFISGTIIKLGKFI